MRTQRGRVVILEDIIYLTTHLDITTGGNRLFDGAEFGATNR